ncbi:MAG: c-type cytochrome [Bacteroidetes bacterium]|nr:c-type cytochrome [Bacteroidota bacterium]
MKRFIKILFVLFIVAFVACKTDPKINTPLPSNNLKELIPNGFPQPAYTFSINSISQDRFILGRELFYERMLSADNTISCGDCHQQFVAFANADHHLSHGINGLLGKRNSPALFNLTWHSSLMHDGGVSNLEVQPAAPIENPVEMGETLANVVNKLQVSSKYKTLFKNAYGTDSVTTQRMFYAMAQFVGLMYSYKSKYDDVKNNLKGARFNETEQRGYTLFLQHCNACHKEPLFSDFKFRSNGLPVDAHLQDSGRARITNSANDLYTFKTPSLRNIALTQPYMHDGRFGTLQQCLDHYTDGNFNPTNLDPLLQTNLQLSAQDKHDIIAFLQTLTDYDFINDPRFSDPNHQ